MALEQLTDEEIERAKQIWYEVNNFKDLSPKAKGGCKQFFFDAIVPFINEFAPAIERAAMGRMFEKIEDWMGSDSEIGRSSLNQIESELLGENVAGKGDKINKEGE